jgi:hypothetical protein
MTFKKGKSGNPNGRPKGALSNRAQLTKLLDPHATDLVQKMIGLALNGDVNALRLCIERLIPKIKYEPIGIELPNNINDKNKLKLKNAIINAIFEGQISVDDAEKLVRLINNEAEKSSLPSLSIPTTDPIEAARIYQRIMLEK